MLRQLMSGWRSLPPLQRRSIMAILGLLSVFFFACSQAVARCASDEVLSSQSQLGQLVFATMSDTWRQQLTGRLYKSISGIGATFALLTIGWYALKVIKAQLSSQSEISLASLEEWVIAIVMILLLANNGQGSLLGTVSLGFRAATNGITNQIVTQLASEANAERGQDINVVEQAQAKLTLQAWVNDQMVNCAAKPNQAERNRCFIAAADVLGQKISCYLDTDWGVEFFRTNRDKFILATSNPGEYGTSDFFTRLFNGLGVLANGITSSLIITWLAAIGTGLILMVDTGMLLTAMMGPIFLGLSFLPLPLKPIQIWVTGLGSLAMMQIAYKVLIGIISSTMLYAPPSDPLVWQLMIAILSPLLVVGMAAGGGVALLNGMGRGASTMVRM